MAVVTLGLGVTAGAATGEAALWYGFAILVLGGVLTVVGKRSSSPTVAEDGVPTLSGVGRELPRKDRGPAPTLRDLGNRVEGVLRLAETQADDHVAAAKRESEAILSAAQLEASEIVAKARADAAGIKGDS
jgi:hypothetical protein